MYDRSRCSFAYSVTLTSRISVTHSRRCTVFVQAPAETPSLAIAADSPSTIADSATGAATSAAPPTSTEPAAGASITASWLRAKPLPEQIAAAATHGRKPNVNRFFTESSGWKKRKTPIKRFANTRFRASRKRHPQWQRLRLGPVEPAIANPAGAETYVALFRSQQGLREWQTHTSESIFPDPKTHPGLERTV